MMRVIIFLFLIVSLKGAEMDLSDVPCKHFLEGPSKDVANANEYTEPSNIDDYKYGTNGKICNIFQSSTSEEHDPGSTSAEVGLVSLRKNFFSPFLINVPCLEFTCSAEIEFSRSYVSSGMKYKDPEKIFPGLFRFRLPDCCSRL